MILISTTTLNKQRGHTCTPGADCVPVVFPVPAQIRRVMIIDHFYTLCIPYHKSILTLEPHHMKSRFMHMRKQRHRSVTQLISTLVFAT